MTTISLFLSTLTMAAKMERIHYKRYVTDSVAINELYAEVDELRAQICSRFKPNRKYIPQNEYVSDSEALTAVKVEHAQLQKELKVLAGKAAQRRWGELRKVVTSGKPDALKRKMKARQRWKQLGQAAQNKTFSAVSRVSRRSPPRAHHSREDHRVNTSRGIHRGISAMFGRRACAHPLYSDQFERYSQIMGTPYLKPVRRDPEFRKFQAFVAFEKMRVKGVLDGFGDDQVLSPGQAEIKARYEMLWAGLKEISASPSLRRWKQNGMEEKLREIYRGEDGTLNTIRDARLQELSNEYFMYVEQLVKPYRKAGMDIEVSVWHDKTKKLYQKYRDVLPPTNLHR